ncbi:MAG: GNAT family N-acetyltransferase [Bacteroidetes bacterium]|nr:GNAT family N-acetyltransferase [Bacteroidota bacterium]
MIPSTEKQGENVIDTSTISIRKAQKEDCSRMMELVNELAVYERAPDEVTVTLEHFVESGFGPQPVWWALVAEVDNVIVGFALYYIRYSTWKGQKMYLEDLLVTEPWRGKGIGTLLVDALIEEANEKNFNGIIWQVLEWNEPAIRFYKRYKVRFDSEWVNVTLDEL